MKLIYFKGIRGRAESVRMMLAYKGVDYTDHGIDLTNWPVLKKKGAFPYNALPALEVQHKNGNTLTIGQSGTINRFVASSLGLYPIHDPAAMAATDEIFEASQDLAEVNPVNPKLEIVNSKLTNALC
jgi:glutathione S-transferase